MLVEFSVKNFLSFKEKVTLSMEKGAGEENLDNVVENLGLLKTTAIYGANASGKSNLLKAFVCSIMMVRNSSYMQVGGKWLLLKQFRFDDSSYKEPSEFEYIIIVDGVKYIYSFSAFSNRICDETLEAYYTQKPTTIFSRKDTSEYNFTIDKNVLESLSSKNTDNKLFLSTATTWNYEKTKPVYLWFSKSIDVFNSFQKIFDRDLVEYSNNEELKTFALKLLKEADILIKNISVSYEEKEVNQQMMDMLIPPLARTSGTFKMSDVKIELEHEIVDSNNNRSTYSLSFDEESSGTKILFTLAPYLKRAFDKNRIIVVDELEKSLHPSLVEFIIKLFNNKNINKANSQLIFTTHAINLLDLDFLRRDQIWFTEKNPDSGISTLYPLDSFSVRKTENIRKGYMNGRYGAIPFIKDVDLWPEDN